MNKIITDSKRIYPKNNIPNEYLESHYMNNIKRPSYVVLPINEEEVIKIVKYANLNNKKIIARGANTGAVGSQMPIIGDEIIVDLSLMNKIVSFDEESLILTVQPGTKLIDVQKFAEEKGLLYGPDPASKDSTIGGNVSTNAGGLRAVKYGTTKKYIKSLRVVLASGEVATLGELTVKSSAGYNLKDLFIGSEGTLGIITEIKLQLIYKPNLTKSIILSFKNIKDATNAVLKILKNKFDVSALELFDKEIISHSEKFLNKDFQSQKGDAYLLLNLESEDEKLLELEIKRLFALMKDKTVDFVQLNDEEAKVAWDLRDNILYALMEFTKYEMLDEVVPINKFAEMVNYTKELENKHAVKILNFGHAGDGNIHTILLQEDYSDELWQEKRKLLLKDIYDKVTELDGLISAEHGIGYTKREHFLTYTNKININLMRSIKKALDPTNMFNPQKIF